MVDRRRPPARPASLPGAARRPAGRVREPQLRPVHRHPQPAPARDLGGWPRLLGRAAASRLRLHQPGRSFSRRGRRVRRLAYDRRRSTTASSPSRRRLADIGFSGFRLSHAVRRPTPDVDFAIFQGATFFRAIARGQNFGVVARALTLQAGRGPRRGIPVLPCLLDRAPARRQQRITIHALLDSEIDERRRAHDLPPRRHHHRRRRDDPVPARQSRPCRPRRHRLRPIFSAPTTGRGFRRRPPGRVRVDRPADAQRRRANGSGGRFTTPKRCRFRPSSTRYPRGFGLLQRDRAFEAFQDDDQRFERRPSSGSSRSATGARAASSSSKSRAMPKSTTTSSPIGGRRPPMAAGTEVALRLPAVLVLAAAGAAARSPSSRRPASAAARRPPPALPRRLHRRISADARRGPRSPS